MRITIDQQAKMTKANAPEIASMLELICCLNNTIDEAREKICESIDAYINLRVTSDKMMERIEGALKDIRASVDDAAKSH